MPPILCRKAPNAIPFSELHTAIRQQIRQNTLMTAKHWVNNPDLHKLYNQIYSKVRRGKPFFGYGNWYTYLEKEHKISVLKARSGTYPKRDYFMVEAEIKNGTPLTPWYWAKSKKLCNLYYRIAHTAGSNGLNFGGHGDWYKYLKNVHGIDEAYAERPKAEKTKSIIERDNSLVQQEIQKGTPMSWAHWRANEKLKKIYFRIQRRKVGGIYFCGHGSWYKYLKNVHDTYVEI